ncbi:hypothetical protein ACSBR1_025470 [Camellia fascicularis]
MDMESESESQKKRYCVMGGDVYGVVMVPNELDLLDKDHSFHLLPFQPPHLTKLIQSGAKVVLSRLAIGDLATQMFP